MILNFTSRRSILLCATALWCSPTDAMGQQLHVDLASEQPFLSENHLAMVKMMNGMHAMPTGDVDRDFASMMVAHHQGAIEMAQAELRHGTNEQLRRISQEIVVEQMQEISAMQMAVGAPLPPSGVAPTQTESSDDFSARSQDISYHGRR